MVDVGRDWNGCRHLQLADMDNSLKTIGAGLRKIFLAFTRLPMSWRLIDAFTRLEEREEAMRDTLTKVKRLDDGAEDGADGRCDGHR